MKKIFFFFFLISALLSQSDVFAQIPQIRFRLKVSGQSFVDECVVRFHPNATPAFDGSLDAYKLGSTNPLAPYIATVSQGFDYAINSLPMQAINTTVPLRVLCGTNGAYNIIFEEIDSLPPSMCLLMTDTYNGNVVDLRTQTPYACVLSDTASVPRFFINVSAPIYSVANPVSCPGGTNGGVTVFNGTGLTYTLNIANLNGDTLVSYSGSDSLQVLGNLAEGTYVLLFDQSSQCQQQTDTIDLSVGAIVADFAFVEDTVDVSMGALLQTVNQSSGADNYQWDFGDGSPPDFTSNPTHNYLGAGDYTVTLIAFYGTCSDTVQFNFVVTNVTSLEKQAFNTQTIFWGQQEIMIDYRTEYLELYSNQGALLWSNQNIINSMVLPYESLRPGMYFLKANGKEKQKIVRLVK
jgi:PKD repeat protein